MEAQAPQTKPVGSNGKRRKPFITIGVRLFFSFLVIIVLTGVIGFLAVQRFSALADATNELNTKDLPEVRMLGSLRSQVFQQYDLEQQLVANGLNEQEAAQSTQTTKIIMQYVVHCTPLASSDGEGDSADTSGQYCVTVAIPVSQTTTSPSTANPGTADLEFQNRLLRSLSAAISGVAKEHALLLQQEPPDTRSSVKNDTPLVNTISKDIVQSAANSQKIQTLIKNKHYTEAYNLEQGTQNALFQNLLTTISRLRSLEASEANIVAQQAQQNSRASTTLILELTALALLLAVVLALIFTRSLTKTLAKLVKASDSIAAGNLEEEPQVYRRDELGHLAEAFDRMRLGLRSTIATLALERQQTQAIIDTGVDGLMLVDEQGIILQFNPAAEQLSGWLAHDALGKPCWEVFAREASEPVIDGQAYWNDILQPGEEQKTAEIEVQSRTGQRRWLAVSAAALPNGGEAPQRQVIGLHDISELKAIDQLKTDFVAMVSHELRAPLTTVTGSVETLDLLDPAADGEAYTEVVGILKQQTQRLRQVVEEVLQLTRLDAGRFQVHLAPLSIAAFCRSLKQQMLEDWVDEDRPLSLSLPGDDILVWADVKVLDVVLRNLLENARKYTPAGSLVEIEVNTLPAVSRVNVRVRDHGPGIPPEQLPRVFERFSRGTQSSYDWSRGYGLGLYIARELLKVHNGDIWAENCPDGGACFILSLCMVSDPFDAPPAENARLIDVLGEASVSI